MVSGRELESWKLSSVEHRRIASLLAGVLSFSDEHGYHLRRREELRRLCSSRVPQVDMRFVMAANDTDVKRADVLRFEVSPVGRENIRKLLLQNAFFRHAVSLAEYDFIARVAAAAAVNISQIALALGRLRSRLPIGALVTFGPFYNFYSWDPHAMDAACWSYGLKAYRLAFGKFQSESNQSDMSTAEVRELVRSMPPEKVHPCIRLEGPYPFAAGPFIAYSTPLARRILRLLGDSERYLIEHLPLVNPFDGVLHQPDEKGHPSKVIFKEEVYWAYLVWKWLSAEPVYLVHAPMSEYQREREPDHLNREALVFHKLMVPAHFEHVAERRYLQSTWGERRVECDDGKLGTWMNTSLQCCSRWQWCSFSTGLELKG